MRERERGVQCIAGSRVLGSLKLDADLSPTASLRREGMPELMHDDKRSHHQCAMESVAQDHQTHEDPEHRVDEA